MKKLFDKLIEVLESAGSKISKLTYMLVVKDSFIDLMPVIITGSFATLINNVVCSPSNGLAQFDGFGFLQQFSPIFSAINYATMNMMGLYLAYLVGAQLTQLRRGPKQFGGLVALISYITLIPTTASATSAAGDVVNISNVIKSNYTNSQGMFLAIIMGILSVEIFCKILNSGKMKINMPEGVPTGVSKSFESLFPGLTTIFLIGIGGYLFKAVVGNNLPDTIYVILQQPMEAIMQHPAGVIVLALVCQLFWLIGIHGSQLIGVVRNSIGLLAIAANLAAYEAGLPMTNIFTYTFWNTYVTIGGIGNTNGLIVAIFLVSKRQDFKTIARLSLIPMFFGINEPLIFGIPIVLNPYLAIPFIFAPMISAAIGYIATAIGFASAAMITVPFTVPPIINAYVTTAGSIGAVITQVICIIVSILL